MNAASQTIEERIKAIPKCRPPDAAAKIRNIYKMIKRLRKGEEKENLRISLENASFLGLSRDLRVLMKAKGLSSEGLALVLHYLTDKPSLAKYLYETPTEELPDGLKIICEKVRPEIEVLGAFMSEHIDVTKKWVQELCEIAPSLRRLSRVQIEQSKILKKCTPGEKRIVLKLVEKSLSGPTGISNEMEGRQGEENSTSSELTGAGGSSTSLEEIVAKASGGLALTGVRYSEYKPTTTAGKPLLLPPRKVEPLSSNKPTESAFLKFAKEKVATKFAKEVQNSGASIGISKIKFIGFPCEFGVAADCDNEMTSSNDITDTTFSVSVTKYLRIGMQAFCLKEHDMNFCMKARSMALSINDATTESDRKKLARKFFHEFGSHIPGGIHELGGIFFCIADIISDCKTNSSVLFDHAVKFIESKVSAGDFVKVELGYHREKDHEEEIQDTKKELKQSFSLISLGPEADDLDSFKRQLYHNNSSWAILDRGKPSAYIPVWELLQDLLGEEFKTPAEVMKQTWNEDEENERLSFEARSEEMEMQERGKKEMRKIAQRELQSTAIDQKIVFSLANFFCSSISLIWDLTALRKNRWKILKGGVQIFSGMKMSQDEAYETAIKLLLDDPKHNICEISNFPRAPDRGYTLRCMRTSDRSPVEYEECDTTDKYPFIFYSKRFYQKT